MAGKRPPVLGPITKKRIVERIPAERLETYLAETFESDVFDSQTVSDRLVTFCLNCPDPAMAMDLVVETLPALTWAEIAGRALACPVRDPNSLPESELHWNDPLRHWKVQ